MATFEWLGPPDGRTPIVNSNSVTIISNYSASQLQFRPLQQSHNGSYYCHAVINDRESTGSSPPLELSVASKLSSK